MRFNHALTISDFGITEAEQTAARQKHPNLLAAQIGSLHALLRPYGLDERSVGRVVATQLAGYGDGARALGMVRG